MSAAEPTNGHADRTEEVPALDDLIDDVETEGEGEGEAQGQAEGEDDELGPAPRAEAAPSDEQPVVVFGVEDSDDEAPVLRGDDEVLPEPDLPTRGGEALAEAYSNLEIRTPPEELDAFARGRVEALARVGQADRAAIAGEALQMAQAALRRVMGSQPREAP